MIKFRFKFARSKLPPNNSWAWVSLVLIVWGIVWELIGRRGDLFVIASLICLALAYLEAIYDYLKGQADAD